VEYCKSALACYLKVSRKQVDYALASEDLRTSRHSESKKENLQKLSERDLDRVELFLTKNGPEGHELTWDKLVSQFGYEVTAKTLRLNMAPQRIFSFIAAEKPYINEKLAKVRLE